MKDKSGKKIILSVLIAMIGLSSCHVTNKYKTPDIDSNNLFRDTKSLDTTTIANIPWKEYFKDPFLQSYIDEGLNNNFDMLITIERIKQAESLLGVARAAYFPDVNLTGKMEQVRLSNADPLTETPRERNTLAYHKETYSLGIVASWELDIWGKMNRQSKAKYADMLNSYVGKNLIQTSLISNIANTYYSLLALDKQLQVTSEMVVLMEKNLFITEALRDAGMTNSAAVEQTRAALYNVRASVPDLKSNIRQLENSICAILGRKPGNIIRSDISGQSISFELAYGVSAQMLAKRPDVQQAELKFRSAFELTNAARVSFYPSVNLTSGILGFSTINGFSNFFKPENLFANIIGGITQPLFARKELISKLKIAKSDQQIALLTFEKTVLSAGQEVSDILYTYESSIEKTGERNIQVEALDKSVYYTQELFKAGEGTYLEVITAQQGLLDAQISQINDKLQQLQAIVDLYRALGGGIE